MKHVLTLFIYAEHDFVFPLICYINIKQGCDGGEFPGEENCAD